VERLPGASGGLLLLKKFSPGFCVFSSGGAFFFGFGFAFLTELLPMTKSNDIG
jgi:hypothetical protein